ncbi:MAG: alpha/beta hydrolase [Gammaproteobacteria bacterium]|nr:alpha/beta hydrolase [Gammaproteobacteria bacterium]
MDQALLQQLSAELPLLEPGRPLQGLGQRYAGYYGIDFSSRVEQHLGRVAIDGFDLALQVWRPAKPQGTLLILHGYYDHMGLYRHLIEWALEQQLAVLGMDLPGHGLSSGERASIDCFRVYQQALDAALAQSLAWGLPAPWHMLGQSTGGGILVDRLLHGPLPEQLGQTILMAPLVRPRQWLLSQMGLRMLGGFVNQLGRKFTDNSSDEEFLRFIRENDPLQPLVLPVAWVQALEKWIPRIEAALPVEHSPLIIQGEADGTVDWQHNIKVLEGKFQSPQLFYLPEARHHLANEREAYRAQYLKWLAERLRLPA